MKSAANPRASSNEGSRPVRGSARGEEAACGTGWIIGGWLLRSASRAQPRQVRHDQLVAHPVRKEPEEDSKTSVATDQVTGSGPSCRQRMLDGLRHGLGSAAAPVAVEGIRAGGMDQGAVEFAGPRGK